MDIGFVRPKLFIVWSKIYRTVNFWPNIVRCRPKLRQRTMCRVRWPRSKTGMVY